jgi:hypothetical protein
MLWELALTHTVLCGVCICGAIEMDVQTQGADAYKPLHIENHEEKHFEYQFAS